MSKPDPTIEELKAIFKERLKRSVADLDQAAGRFRAIAQASPDAVLVADHHSIIIYANEMAAKMFGYDSYKDLLGMALTALMPPKFRAAHLIGMMRYITTGEARLIGKLIEIPFMKRDGSIHKGIMSLSSWRSEPNGYGEYYFVAFIRNGSKVISVESLVGSNVEGAIEEVSDLVEGD